MRRAKFQKLVNYYLDGEITEAELRELRHEMARCPEHRALFETYRRLNLAACKARFDTECLFAGAGGSHSRESFSWGLWGGAVGTLAGIALFAVAVLNVQHSPAVEVVEVEGLKARAVAAEHMFAQDAFHMDIEDGGGFQLSAFQHEPLDFPPARTHASVDLPTLFPMQSVQVPPLRPIRLLEDSPFHDYSQYGTPVLFKVGE